MTDRRCQAPLWPLVAVAAIASDVVTACRDQGRAGSEQPAVERARGSADAGHDGSDAAAAAQAVRRRPLIVLDGAAGATGDGAVHSGPPEGIDIPACDRYLAQHYRCITRRLPAALRPMALEALHQTRRDWRRALDQGTGGVRLADSCEILTESTREAMARHGCRY